MTEYCPAKLGPAGRENRDSASVRPLDADDAERVGVERPDDVPVGADAPPTHMIAQTAVRCPGRAGIAQCSAVVLHPDSRRVLGVIGYDFDHVVTREAAELVALTIGLRKARYLGARRVSAQSESRFASDLLLGRTETDDGILRVYLACHRQEEAKLERVIYERITGDLNAARQIAGQSCNGLRLAGAAA